MGASATKEMGESPILREWRSQIASIPRAPNRCALPVNRQGAGVGGQSRVASSVIRWVAGWVWLRPIRVTGALTTSQRPANSQRA